MITSDRVKEYIEGHMQTSHDYRVKSGTVQVYPDPQVSGTFAARFYDNNYDETVGLLFVTSHLGYDITAGNINSALDDCLEEVEYEDGVWPPKSGELKFF